jgi:hypothetical protein
MERYTFRTIPLSIIRSLFAVHSAMVYVIQVCRQLSSRTRMELVWHIPLLSVQWINSWWWTEKLSETCRVSCQNKFEKLVRLFGFILKNFFTVQGHMNVKFWLCLLHIIFMFVFLFCIFVFYCVYSMFLYLLCVVSPFVYICLFPLIVQIYRPLPKVDTQLQ